MIQFASNKLIAFTIQTITTAIFVHEKTRNLTQTMDFFPHVTGNQSFNLSNALYKHQYPTNNKDNFKKFLKIFILIM